MIDGETAKRISTDVACDVSPRDSELLYSEEMLAFYQTVQKEFADIRAKHPRAVLDIKE